MKFTICGFDQESLVNIGLDATDIIILRYLVDFYATDGMLKTEFEGEEYFWVKYEAIIDALPVLGIKTKRSVYNRMMKMVDLKLLKTYTYRVGGTFSYYKFTDLYSVLVGNNIPRVGSGVHKGSEAGFLTPRKQSSELTISLLKDNSIKDNKRRFSKPNPEEVKEYAKSISFDLDGEMFCDHYNANGWMVGRTKMKDWKSAVRNWKRRNKNRSDKNDVVVKKTTSYSI